MNKKIIACITSILTCVAVGAFVGCKDEENSSSSSTQTFVELEDFEMGFGTSYEIITDAENLVWQSSNQNVATVTQEGVVFGMGIGETTITVTDGVQTESCTLTVSKSNVVAQCSLYPAQAIQLNVNDEYPLKPRVSVAGVTLDYVAFDYESSNAAVATVDDNGVITAVALGDTTISVSYEAGGFEDTLEIPVKVVEDVVIELNQLDVTLAVEEIAGGTYKSETEIFVTALQVDDVAVDVNQVTLAIADDTIASYEGTTLTALKAGRTTLTATYQNQNTTVTMYVPVNVVKERIRIEETGSVDVSWDATTATPVNYAFIELPYTLQLTDEEVELVADERGDVLTENNGLCVPKAAIKDATTKLCVETAKFAYELDVTMDTSCITLTKLDYTNQFTNPEGVKATALKEEMDGREDVLKTVNKKIDHNPDGDVWFIHCGYLNFDEFEKSWSKGIFVFDVKAEEGTPLGGFVCRKDFSLNTETMKFSLPSNIIKIVDENYNETTFQYGEWNTVVVDYTQIEDAPRFLPSFAYTDKNVDYTAYYSNMRYMTVDAYEKLKNESYERKYTVTFETGYEELDFAPQEVGFRDNVDTSVLEIGDEYEFIGWLYNEQLVKSIENLYVTEDITLTAFYDKVFEYKVVYLQRQINGSYKEVDISVSEGKMLTEVTAELKTFEGYTLNESLSVTKGKVLANDKLVLAVYYENDDYKFETQTLTGVNDNGCTLTKKDLTGVAATDIQANTYEVVQTATNGTNAVPEIKFMYSADKVGQYLVLTAYFTRKATPAAKVSNANWAPYFWTADNKYITNDTPVSAYDTNGKFLPAYNADTLVNRWVTIVKKIPEGNTTNGFLFTLSHYAADSWYLGEYAYLTEAQFKANFEYLETTDTTKLPDGVVGYRGDSLTYFSKASGVNCLDFANGRILYISKGDHHSECTVSPSGVTTWSAGQYVAVKAYSYTLTGVKISLFNQTRVAIYDVAGNEVADTAVQANQWYTYVFKIGENDVTIGKYSGSIMVTTVNTAGIKFQFESVYSIADDDAYAAFKEWKGWNA